MRRLKTTLRNGMAINIITDNIIMFLAILSCGVWYEAQQRYASTVISYCQLLIVNRQLSIIKSLGLTEEA